MKELLYWIVEWIAKIHSHILRLNDAYEYNFTDKELHFLVIGMMGMGFIFVVYPVFKWLAKHDHVMVIAWIYVLTLIIVITFAIEIGQKVTGTGNMEFADAERGLWQAVKNMHMPEVDAFLAEFMDAFSKTLDEQTQE